jgi:hypothetical protein
MSYNYAPLAAKAVAMLAKYGKTVQVQYDTSSAPADANKPWRGPVSALTTKNPKALTVSFDKHELDGERIKASDIKLLIAAQDTEMAGVDIDRVKFATVAGVTYGATDVSPLEPGDTRLLYTLRLRNS